MPSCGCPGRLRARAGHAALSRQAKWMSEYMSTHATPAHHTAPRCLPLMPPQPPHSTPRHGVWRRQNSHHAFTRLYSLVEQDVIGGLPCVAYSTSSNPWEADYCSLWVTQHAIQSATARSSPALCKMALAGRSHQSALADSAAFDQLGRLRLPRAGRRREGHRLRRRSGRRNR